MTGGRLKPLREYVVPRDESVDSDWLRPFCLIAVNNNRFRIEHADVRALERLIVAGAHLGDPFVQRAHALCFFVFDLEKELLFHGHFPVGAKIPGQQGIRPDVGFGALGVLDDVIKRFPTAKMKFARPHPR